jgi:hypothetical protein
MGFETSPFGYADGSNVSGTVVNHYGARETQVGVASGGELAGGEGAVKEAVIFIKGSDFTSGSFDTRLTIPDGAKFLEAYVEVTEAFALGGTTPTMNIGTSGSAGTNYAIELSEANAEAVGEYYNATGAGTWGSPLAADTTVAVELDGTSPTVTSAGEAKVVIRYIKI